MFFRLISRNIIKKVPNKINKYKTQSDEIKEDDLQDFVAEDRIKDMLDAM